MTEFANALECDVRIRQRDARNDAFETMETIVKAAREKGADLRPDLCKNGTLSESKLFETFGDTTSRNVTWTRARSRIKNDPDGYDWLGDADISAILQLGKNVSVNDQLLQLLEKQRQAYHAAYRTWELYKNESTNLERKFHDMLRTVRGMDSFQFSSLNEQDAAEDLFRQLLLEPMVQGKRSIALSNMDTVTAFVTRNVQHFDATSEQYLKLLATMYNINAFVCYRLGDGRHDSFVNFMRQLNRHIPDDGLRQNIWLHEHYGCLRSGAALSALEWTDTTFGIIRKGGLQRRGDDLSRVFVFASEVGIHRGASLEDRLRPHHKLTIGELLWEAYEKACERNDFDSAFRFRTVRVRALLWTDRPNEARTEIERLEIDLEDEEAKQNQHFWHVRHRISIDKALLAYLDRGRDDDDELARTWLRHAHTIADRIGAPFMTPAHELEYGNKWYAFKEGIETI